MFERLSGSSRQAFARAQGANQAIGVGVALHSGHLLLGLAGRPGDQAERALTGAGVTAGLIRVALHQLNRSEMETGRPGDFSEELKAIVVTSIALRPDGDDVTTGDLLLATVSNADSVGVALLNQIGTDIEVLEAAVRAARAEDDPPWVPASPGTWAITVSQGRWIDEPE